MHRWSCMKASPRRAGSRKGGADRQTPAARRSARPGADGVRLWPVVPVNKLSACGPCLPPLNRPWSRARNPFRCARNMLELFHPCAGGRSALTCAWRSWTTGTTGRAADRQLWLSFSGPGSLGLAVRGSRGYPWHRALFRGPRAPDGGRLGDEPSCWMSCWSEWAPVAVAGAVLHAADDVVGGLAASQFAGLLARVRRPDILARRASR
jgi:hypothetical protein